MAVHSSLKQQILHVHTLQAGPGDVAAQAPSRLQPIEERACDSCSGPAAFTLVLPRNHTKRALKAVKSGMDANQLRSRAFSAVMTIYRAHIYATSNTAWEAGPLNMKRLPAWD